MVHWYNWVKGIGKGEGRMMPHDRSGEWTAFKREYQHSFEQYKRDAQNYFGSDFEIRVAQTKTQFKVQYRRIKKSLRKGALANWTGKRPKPSGDITLYISRLQAKHMLEYKRRSVERIVRVNDGEQVLKIKIALSD